MAENKPKAIDVAKVIVAAINWDASDDDMDSRSVRQFVAKAFSEYKQKKRHKLKSRIANATHMWILEYNDEDIRESPVSLECLNSTFYMIKKKGQNIGLVKSKTKISLSTKNLDANKISRAILDEPIAFAFLEDLKVGVQESDVSKPNIAMHYEKIKGFENCYANQKALDFLTKKQVISRYTTYHRFKELVEAEKIAFFSPDRWEDPFEKIYFNTKIRISSNNKPYKPPQIACLCFTKCQYENSAAFWKNFKVNENERLVRIEFDFDKLIRQISERLKKRNLGLYVSAVDYSLNEKSIKEESSFVKEIKERMKKADASSVEKIYVSMLSYKRKPFRFEKEIRFFIIPTNGSFGDDEFKHGIFELGEFKYSNVVKRVFLEPIRLPSGWVSIEAAKKEIIGMSVEESKLYTNRKKCKEMDFTKE